MHLFCQASNFLGIFPVLYCIQFKAYGLACVLATAFGLSAVYHTNEKNNLFLLADTVGVSLLVAAGVTVLKNSSHVVTVSNLLTVLYSAAGFTCFILAGDDTDSEDYKIFHAAWHIFSTYGIATFLYSYFNANDAFRQNQSRLLAKPMKHLIIRTGRRREAGERTGRLFVRKRSDAPVQASDCLAD